MNNVVKQKTAQELAFAVIQNTANLVLLGKIKAEKSAIASWLNEHFVALSGTAAGELANEVAERLNSSGFVRGRRAGAPVPRMDC